MYVCPLMLHLPVAASNTVYCIAQFLDMGGVPLESERFIRCCIDVWLRLLVMWRTWHFVLNECHFPTLRPQSTTVSFSLDRVVYSKASSVKRRIYPFMSFVIVRNNIWGPGQRSLWDNRGHYGFLWHGTIDHYHLCSSRLIYSIRLHVTLVSDTGR